MNLENLISAVKEPNWEEKLKEFTYKQSFDFINRTERKNINLALEIENENSKFIFAIGAIYVKAKSTRCFPIYLAELIYKHVFQDGQGKQLFLEILNKHFGESKKMW